MPSVLHAKLRLRLRNGKPNLDTPKPCISFFFCCYLDGDGTYSNSTCQMPTIAVLFLVIDALPFADIWQRWVTSSRTHPRSARVRFYLHAKDRDTLLRDRRTPRWVRECTLPISYQPEWGSVELVRATLALIEEALRDDSVDWLLLASESCLPVTSLDAALRALTSADAGAGRSWLMYDLPHSRFDAERFDTLREALYTSDRISPAAICKADQWFCLTRCHAQAVVDGGRGVFWRAFKTITASDEWYFATCMCLCTFLDLAVLRAYDNAVKDQERRRELYGPRLPLPPLATVEDRGNVSGMFVPCIAVRYVDVACISFFTRACVCVCSGTATRDVSCVACGVEPVAAMDSVHRRGGA